MSRVCARLLLAVGFCVIGALPVAAADPIELGFSPANPGPTDEILAEVVVTFNSNVWFIGMERLDHEILLNFGGDCGPIQCSGPEPWYFALPLGQLEPGIWRVVARVNGGLEQVANLVVSSNLVGRAQLSLLPERPTQNDRARVAIPYQVAPCNEVAQIGAVERQGNLFKLDLVFTTGEIPCTQEATTLRSTLVELGQLDPGSYAVELWARRVGEDPVAPHLIARRTLEVLSTADTVTLLGRYRVSLAWKTADGARGLAKPVATSSAESALFTFFAADNWEVVVKVLDGCAINGNRWVFLAAATDVEFTLTVDDLQDSGPPYQYVSPPGLHPPLADTAAFRCAP